jgi:hypothetical protein
MVDVIDGGLMIPNMLLRGTSSVLQKWYWKLRRKDVYG